jgi:hypothetical protein
MKEEVRKESRGQARDRGWGMPFRLPTAECRPNNLVMASRTVRLSTVITEFGLSVLAARLIQANVG